MILSLKTFLLCFATAVAFINGSVGHALNLETTNPPKINPPPMKKINLYISTGQWGKALTTIHSLKQHPIKGHLLASLYLDSSYKTSIPQLKEWLQQYNHYGEAVDIYNLAVRKMLQQKIFVALPEPSDNVFHIAHSSHINFLNTPSFSYLSPKKRFQAIQLWQDYREALSKGKTFRVKTIVNSAQARKLLNQYDHDTLRSFLGYIYFFNKRYAWSIQWANKALKSGSSVYHAYWTLGLSYWMIQDYEKSEHAFATLATLKGAHYNYRSAGAFWAARAAIKQKKIHWFYTYLALGKSFPLSFYTLLAKELLGSNYKNTLFSQSSQQVAETLQRTEILKRLYSPKKSAFENSLLPHNALKRLHVLFNKLNWYPTNGFQIKPDLISAIVRKESAFNPAAISSKNAFGLMQIKPDTAQDMQKKYNIDGSFESPETNLDIGQYYIQDLFQSKTVQDNLIFMLMSYNAGPQKLKNHLKTITLQQKQDPFLFIESFAFGETRAYVKDVLFFFWINQIIQKNHPQSLIALVHGQWPYYQNTPDPQIYRPEEGLVLGLKNPPLASPTSHSQKKERSL